ncbi:diaminobutyrate acetyltransferase [Halomonas daqingensis]|uniref:diaminobutyrate acetyltransferase n=1 Tax=Billgrantia desiderata TaxID=52021 RepID=UPI001F3A5E08|nr:diaminobutyrate acetyltransferase [Halomonas desiderata]MCE8027711.1 diaminobutyrate acetyltransferase [Halomonas desiderata]
MSQYVFKQPTIHDAKDMYHLACETTQLDRYPEYFYLLWCRDFQETSLIAKKDGDLIGFVIGYIRPDFPSTLLIWQQATQKSVINRGLGVRLLNDLICRCKDRGVDFVEATIDPCNYTAERTLLGISKMHRTSMEKAVIFEQKHFSVEHHAEMLVKVGPLPAVET